jgi:chromosome segregation ATPase
MSVDGETLSAITGMEEACATARRRVEDLVAELDDLRRCIRSVITQRDEARARNSELAEKAATWIASPEAAQRLDGYRDLGQQVAEAQRERDEARAEVEQLKAQHLERHLESWEQYMQDNDVRRAYRRGAEAMREKAALAIVCPAESCPCKGALHARIIRALPIPEEP